MKQKFLNIFIIILTLLALTFSALGATPAQAAGGPLVGRWYFASGSLNDTSGNGYNAFIAGAPAPTASADARPGGDGTSYYFNGAGGQGYLQANLGSEISGNHTFTVSFWMKYIPAPQRQWALLLGNPSTNNGVHWLINTDGSAQFGLFNGAQNSFSLAAYANQWIKVTTIYNSSAGRFSTYINGNLVSTTSGATPAIPAGTNVLMGYDAFYPADYPFYGRIDDFEVWDCVANTTVFNTNDSGADSLRQAIADVCPDGTITFDSSLSGQTITLTSLITINKNITIDGSTLASQVTISGNNAVGIFQTASARTVTLDSLKIINGNVSSGPDGDGRGAGVFNQGYLTVKNSTFANNHASFFGGAIYNDPYASGITPSLTISNSTFVGNSSGSYAGAVGNEKGLLTISNSTFSGNSAPAGGAIAGVNTGAVTTIKNATIANNTTTGNGSGIWTNAGTTTSIYNTIIAHNTGSVSECSGVVSASSNNIIMTDGCGTTGVITSDPLLNTLASNGGPTQTMSLQAGSPALGAGSAAVCAAAPVNNLDQRGQARPQGDAVCDIGAYESNLVTPHTVTFNANGGIGSMSPQTASSPTALTSNTFTRSGYAFAGWNTAAGGGGTAYANGATYSFAADITLYAQWTAVANALDFDGVNDKVSITTMPTNLTDFTLEFWVYLRSSDNLGRIVSTTSDMFEIGTNGGSTIQWYFYAPGPWMSGPTISLNKWTHLAFIRSGSNFYIYKDGVLATTASGVSTYALPAEWYLGQRWNNSSERANMVLDEVRVWNVARSPAQISANLNSELSSQANLVALYHFNQGLPGGNNAGVTTALDDGGSSRNGTLNNFALTGATSNWVSGFVPDTTVPTVTAFTATTPSSSLNIPITTFTATDNAAVAGYLITESSTPPAAGAAGWTGTAPTTYTVPADGSYTLYPWAKDGAGNVSAVFGSPATVSVDTKTDPTLSVTNSPVTYNGSAQSASVSGSVAGTVTNVKYNGSATVPTNAGTYAITADFAPTDTAHYNNLIGASAGTFVISKAVPTISITSSPVTYTGTPQAANIAGSVSGVASSVLYSGSATVPTAAGSYTVTANFTPSDTTNYTVLFSAPAGAFVIDQAILNVAAVDQTKVYGEIDPALTYTHDPLLDGDSFSGALTRVAGENVSLYAITQGNLSAGGNYIINFTPASLEITPRAVTVTADDKSIYFGSPDPAFTFGASGFLGLDTFTVDPTCGVAGPHTAVGTYPIACSGGNAGPNYSLGYVNGTFSVNPKYSLTVTADDKTINYGQAEPSFTFVYSGFVDGDTNITGTAPTCSVTGPHTDAGSYPIVCEGGSDIKYNFSYTSGTLTIKQIDINVAAVNKTKVYGEVDPALTYTSDPLQGSDTFSGSLTREAGSDVGTYNITQGNLSAGSNYIIHFTAASLEITPKPINVTAHPKTKPFGTADPALTYNSDPLLGGDTFTGALSREPGEALGGIYPITQGNLSAGGNYTIHYTGANLTITAGLYASVNVYIGTSPVALGNYILDPGQSTRPSYTENNGPLRVVSTTGKTIIVSERHAWKTNGVYTSYGEMMGLPSNQLSTSYVFPWYNNQTMNTELRVGNVGSGDTTITVRVAGSVIDSFDLAQNASARKSYNINNGPMEVSSSSGVNIIATQRYAWMAYGVYSSVTEMIGLPASQLTDTYVFPWYNNQTMDTQLRIGNVGAADTTITVKIGGSIVETFALAQNTSARKSYNLNAGPVEITSSGGVKIIATERHAWKVHVYTSYAEMLGLPGSQLTTQYVFPWYNNATMNTELRIGNVGGADTTVTVKIAGQVVETFTLAKDASARKSYANLNNGPLEVSSSAGVNIITTLRFAWMSNGAYSSITEMMGLPFGSLTDTYVFPWYNNSTMDTQLRIGVP